VNQLKSRVDSLANPPPPPEDPAVVARRELTKQIRNWLSVMPTSTGVSPLAFFDGLTVQYGRIDRDAVDATIHASWLDEAIDMAAPPKIDVFFVQDTPGTSLLPYVVVTKKAPVTQWLKMPGD